MSLVDQSTQFSFSSIPPVVSPCGKNIAYVTGSKLVVRKIDTLSLERIIKVQIKDRNPFLKITQIQWEPEDNGSSNKIAVLIGNESIIKVFDISDDQVDITIIEDDVFGIQRLEWLPKGIESVQTAYDGSKQIIVFTESEIAASIYSFDYSQPILTIEKPKFNKIFHKPNSSIFSLITTQNNHYYLQSFVNDGSAVEHFNKTELSTFLNLTESPTWSPDGQWFLCNDSCIGSINISIFSLFNESLSKNIPVFKFESDIDSLGAIDAQWVDNKCILVSDHHEQIHYLGLETGLISISYTIRHLPDVENPTIWRQDSSSKKYLKKQSPHKIPQISSLPLVSNGVLRFLVRDNYIYSVTKSMPTAVFIWSLSNKVNEPLDVILTNTKVKDIQLSKENHLLIVNEDSVSIWNSTWSSPLSFPVLENPESLVKGAAFAGGSDGVFNVVVWLNDSFSVIKLKFGSSIDFDNMDTEQFDTIRNGSPALVDDSTNVVELAKGVQQSEWGHNQTGTVQLEDTFMNKRRKPLID